MTDRVHVAAVVVVAIAIFVGGFFFFLVAPLIAVAVTVVVTAISSWVARVRHARRTDLLEHAEALRQHAIDLAREERRITPR